MKEENSFHHGDCHAWTTVHGCPGCPVCGSNEECPTESDMQEIEKETIFEGTH
jgi:hypothetical protein